jgi:hypothetical protein
MDDAVAVSLKFCARAGGGFRIAAAARLRGMRRVRREVRFECLLRRPGDRRDACRRVMLYIVAAPVSHRVLRNMGGAS